MKCLVTGGAGFVGYNLSKQLLELGHKVTVWDDLSSGSNILSKTKFCSVDISKIDNYKHKFDIIYHLAAISRIQPSIKNPVRTNEVNVTGTLNILEIARRCNAKVVFAGSCTATDNNSPYATTKWMGEKYCELYNKLYGISTAIARFYNVYGPNHHRSGPFSTVIGIFEQQKLDNKPFTVVGDGRQRRDFIHVDDVVQALIKIGDESWDGNVFNIGTSYNYSILQVLDMFSPCGIIHLSGRQGEVDITLADTEYTRDALGWWPIMRLEEYISDFIATI